MPPWQLAQTVPCRPSARIRSLRTPWLALLSAPQILPQRSTPPGTWPAQANPRPCAPPNSKSPGALANPAQSLRRHSTRRFRPTRCPAPELPPLLDILFRPTELLHPRRSHADGMSSHRTVRASRGSSSLRYLHLSKGKEHLLLYSQVALGPSYVV